MRKDHVYSFFINKLEIKEYGPKIEIEKKLNEFDNNRIKPNDSYYETIIGFAKYSASGEKDIDFSKHAIFLCNDNNCKILFKGSELVMDEVYGFECGKDYAKAVNKKCLSIEYFNRYNNDDITLFMAFAKKCGVTSSLLIKSQEAKYNPLFYSKLYSEAKSTGKGTNIDYTIDGLSVLLRAQSLKISKAIWDTLIKYGKESAAQRYLFAQYAPNTRSASKKCDSSLIYYLQQAPWVIDKNGNFRTSGSMNKSELHDSFKCDSSNPLINALRFGSDASQEKKEIADLKEKAKKHGGVFITQEEYDRLKQLEMEKQLQNISFSSREMPNLSAKELLEKQNKPQKAPAIESASYLTSDNSKRSGNDIVSIVDTFSSLKQLKPQEQLLFAKISGSNRDEKRKLYNWYFGACQICNTKIIKHNGKPHFNAINIISTQDLTSSIKQTERIGWNSICLCPNCASKYKYCAKDLTGVYDQIVNTETDRAKNQNLNIKIVLDGQIQEIKYVPQHFIALRTVLIMIQDEVDE